MDARNPVSSGNKSGDAMKVSIFGMGYVGVVTGACLARLGHSVIGIDKIAKKVQLIRQGQSPVLEPGLSELVSETVGSGNFTATFDVNEAIENADAILVCVGTPSNRNGEVDLSYIKKVAREIGTCTPKQPRTPIIMFRSTVPPGTMETVVEPLIAKYLVECTLPKIVYHPEFLREGSAIRDFIECPQIVVGNVSGLENHELESFLAELYGGINFTLKIVRPRTAEMIKYANNTFHALKVSFANELGRLCRENEVDTHELFELFLSDAKLNISTAYLRPGFAFGGSCLPKDLRAICQISKRSNVEAPLISNIERSNDEHIDAAFQLILDSGFRKIGFLGLGFKPGTDDLRESPFLKLIEKCIGKGLNILIFDRTIVPQELMGSNLAYLNDHQHIAERLRASLEEVIDSSDFLVLCHPSDSYLDNTLKTAERPLLDLTGRHRPGQSFGVTSSNIATPERSRLEEAEALTSVWA